MRRLFIIMTNEVTLDTIDAKILDFLQKDARTSLALLAKECNLTPSAIHTRIKNLKRQGVIVGNNLLVNSRAFGYPLEVTVGVIAEAPRFHKIAEEIRSLSNVIVCAKSIGRYNMLCLILAEDTAKLDRVVHRIKTIEGVKGTAVNIIIDHIDIMHKKRPLESNAKAELDSVDLSIIDELIIDSSVSFNNIAKKINVSHETVKKRFEKMKEKGVIIACSAVVDYSKLGYQGTAFIFVKLVHDSKKEIVINNLRRFKEIRLLSSVMGAFDLIAFVLFKNLREFTQLINEIQQIPGVGQVEISLANFTYYAFKPLPRAPLVCDTLELS